MAWVAELEAQLCAYPEDWATWQIYADWLVDQGDVRGQILHMEDRLQRGGLSNADTRGLQRELRALVAPHREEWREDFALPEDVTLHWFRHFIWELEWRREPDIRAIREVVRVVRAHRAGRLLAALNYSRSAFGWTLSSLLSVEILRSFTSLKICGSLEREEIRLLASSESLRGLTRLGLSTNSLQCRGVSTLAGSRTLSRLTSLSLTRNQLGSMGAIALARSGAFPALTSLDLSYNGIGPEGVAALTQSETLRGLTSLELTGNPACPRSREGDKGPHGAKVRARPL